MPLRMLLAMGKHIRNNIESESLTSLSLLMQIRQGDKSEEAWRTFVERYGSRIYAWCLNRRLQPGDAEDVAQNVLLKLAKALQNFEYDHSCSFRAWLRRVTENAINDFFGEQRKQHSTLSEDNLSMLDQAEAHEDLFERLSGAFDLELLDQAIELVKQRVSKSRFAAWELTTREELSGTEVAKQLNMKIASVYTAKNQVRQLIQEQLQLLENGL